MFKRSSESLAPQRTGVLARSMFIGSLALGTIAGCGTPEEFGALQQEITETKAATVVQADVDSVTDAVKIRNCAFSVAAGTGTFTPSNELSQALYGDPNGAAHKLSFAVPSLSTSGATIDIASLNAEFNNTGITIAGTNTTVKLSFNALLRVSVTVPIFGRLPADIQIRSSSISAALGYDKATERIRVTGVTSRIDAKTQKCGGSGWCNGLVDGILKSNLAGWIEAPLRDALTKALDDPDRTEDLQGVLLFMYNRKDPKPTPWTYTPHTLELTGGAFKFGVERITP